MRQIAVLMMLSLGGCAVMPDTIPVEIQHTSHITQHFGPERTNMGWNTFFVGAKWRQGPVNFEIRDGYSLEPVDGRHEVFEASIKYEFRLKR